LRRERQYRGDEASSAAEEKKEVEEWKAIIGST
jgi:hypothetical protein